MNLLRTTTVSGRRRRQTLAVAAGLAMAVGLAACGGGSSSGDDTAAPSDERQSGAVADAFPVTIEHKHGTTEITEEPERVVALGFQEQDAILALGVKPVAARYWFGDKNDVIFPWAEDEATALPGDAPEILNMPYDSLNFEAIAALRPDVILGIYSGMTEQDYAKLSAIAPTVAQPDAYVDFGVPWQVSTQMVGDALGRSDQAEQLVDDVEAKFAAVAAAHPKWATQTLALATYQPAQVGIFASQDPRSRFFSSLGFQLPAEFDKIAGDQFYGNISRERLDLLDADLLVWDQMAYVEGGRATIEGDEIVKGLAVARDGRSVFFEGDTENAFAFNSVLSLPYVLDQVVPLLEAASERVAG